MSIITAVLVYYEYVICSFFSWREREKNYSTSAMGIEVLSFCLKVFLLAESSLRRL